VETEKRYRRFATAEAHGQSACYEAWALGVADDQLLLDLINELPEAKRQPNLIFAAARFAGIGPGPFGEFRAELTARWAEVREIALAKRTQTNEPGRCAVLLPLVASLPQPLALIEVGASAGLCLYPDKFSYRYGDLPAIDPAGGSGPQLRCRTSGPVPIPTRLPEIVWRAGIDINPLDVTSPEDVRWLETLIWPGQAHRRAQLAAAVALARADPPTLVRGDANEALAEVMRSAPNDATLVVFHSAVLAYFDHAARDRFIETMRGSSTHWIANEGPGVVPMPGTKLPAAPDATKAWFVIAHNGEPVAYADGHGQALHWFGRADQARPDDGAAER